MNLENARVLSNNSIRRSENQRAFNLGMNERECRVGSSEIRKEIREDFHKISIRIDFFVLIEGMNRIRLIAPLTALANEKIIEI
jgi:hypothetical protein